MSDNELIERLSTALAEKANPTIPLNIRLWDIATIAQYLNRNPDVVRQRIVCLPSFPPAIRLPSGEDGVGKPMWKAAEVIAWVESHRDTMPRRRRSAQSSLEAKSSAVGA